MLSFALRPLLLKRLYAGCSRRSRSTSNPSTMPWRTIIRAPTTTRLLILPSHRSYMDFVICPYLFYHLPGLGIKIPRIAAQDEFSRLPIPGALPRRLGAFYVKRGVGRPDPQLNEVVHQLVEQDEHVLFFLEGQRSRSRSSSPLAEVCCGPFKTPESPLRSYPYLISYERVPEEESFISEAQERERGPYDSTRLAQVDVRHDGRTCEAGESSH